MTTGTQNLVSGLQQTIHLFEFQQSSTESSYSRLVYRTAIENLRKELARLQSGVVESEI